MPQHIDQVSTELQEALMQARRDQDGFWHAHALPLREGRNVGAKQRGEWVWFYPFDILLDGERDLPIPGEAITEEPEVEGWAPTPLRRY